MQIFIRIIFIACITDLDSSHTKKIVIGNKRIKFVKVSCIVGSKSFIVKFSL